MSRHGVVFSFQTKYLNIFDDGYALRLQFFEEHKWKSKFIAKMSKTPQS